jgi:hypothetical protein
MILAGAVWRLPAGLRISLCAEEACEQRVDWLNAEHSNATLINWLHEVLKCLKDYGHEKLFLINVLLAGLPLSQDCLHLEATLAGCHFSFR